MIRASLIPLVAAASALLLLAAAAVPAPAAAQIQPLSVLAQRGGEIATGTYHCRQQYNAAGYTVKVVEITGPTGYAWIYGGRKPGTMRYDAASGRIAFTGGPMAKGFEAHAGRRDDGVPLIILVDTDLAPKPDAYDYCVRRPPAAASR